MADVVRSRSTSPTSTSGKGSRRPVDEHFSGDFPTATTVQVVALADPAYKVEIDAIAHIGKGR